MYKIERVPLPSREIYPFSTMEPGGSFWKSKAQLGGGHNLHQSKTAAAMRQYAKNSGKKFRSAVEESKHRGKMTAGMRFYRVS